MKKILFLLIMLPQISHSSDGPLSYYIRESLTIVFTNQTNQNSFLHLTSTNCPKGHIAIPSTFNTTKLHAKAHKTRMYTLRKETRAECNLHLEDFEIIEPHQNISALLFATLMPNGRIKFHSPQNRIILR
jgi:hypothetical protein